MDTSGWQAEAGKGRYAAICLICRRQAKWRLKATEIDRQQTADLRQQRQQKQKRLLYNALGKCERNLQLSLSERLSSRAKQAERERERPREKTQAAETFAQWVNNWITCQTNGNFLSNYLIFFSRHRAACLAYILHNCALTHFIIYYLCIQYFTPNAAIVNAS